MDLRVLHYFLAIAGEKSFTKAAEQLHITQPTLSRQIAALEEELGARLLVRGGQNITLTEEGLLLKRRALEIIDLEERVHAEFKGSDELIEGSVNIGTGEFAAVETLAKICSSYHEKYPMVHIGIHTGNADDVLERMNKGLVDIGLFMDPFSTDGYDYIRLPDTDHYVAGMRPDDPLAEKEYITKDDLLGKSILISERTGVQSVIRNWFGKDFNRIQNCYSSNLGTNSAVFAMYGLAYPVSIEGAAKYWRQDLLVQRPLYPPIQSQAVIAWRRNITYSRAVQKFIEELSTLKTQN